MTQASTSPDQRQQRLERLLARGRRSFILRVGVLAWGLPAWILFWLTESLLIPWLRGQPLPSPDSLLLAAIVQLPIWLFAGYWFGRLLWRRSVA